jgi:hypothetical protein
LFKKKEFLRKFFSFEILKNFIMKKIIFLFLCIICTVALVSRGSPISVVVNDHVSYLVNSQTGLGAVVNDVSAENSLFATLRPVGCFGSEEFIFKPLVSHAVNVKLEGCLLGSMDNPPGLTSSNFSYNGMWTESTQALYSQEVDYNIIKPMINSGVNNSRTCAAVDLKKLDAAGVEYTSKADMTSLKSTSTNYTDIGMMFTQAGLWKKSMLNEIFQSPAVNMSAVS